MPRGNSVPSRNYSPGVYGPFSVDGFTEADTTKLRVTMTAEAWPDVPKVADVTLTWGNGTGASFGIAGRSLNRDGTLRSTVVLEVDVPRDAGGQVSSGTASMTVHSSFRTAITIQAI